MNLIPAALAVLLSSSDALPPAKLTAMPITKTPNSRWISPDASMSAVAGEDSITVWSLPKGKPLFRIEAPPVERASPDDRVVFEPVAFSNDGRYLLAHIDHRLADVQKSFVSNAVKFVLVSVVEEKIARTLYEIGGPCAIDYGIFMKCTEILSAYFSGDGQRVVVNVRRYLPGHNHGARDVKFTNSSIVLTLDGQKLIEESETQRHILHGEVLTEKPNRFWEQLRGIDRDGRMLGVAADKHTCALMDLSSKKRLAFLDDCNDKDVVALETNHGYAYSWLPSGPAFKLWNFDGTLRASIPLDRSGGADSYIRPSGDGRYVLEIRRVNGASTLRLWDSKSSRIIGESSEAGLATDMSAPLTADRRHIAMHVNPDLVYAKFDAGAPLAPSASYFVARIEEPAAPKTAAAAAPAPVAAPAANFDAPPASTVKPDPNAYALLIGIEKYRQAGIPAVDYAARDARTMYDYLTISMGFDAKNVLLLTDDQATRADFDKNLKWLSNRATESSRVFVYYAGHGSPNSTTGEGYLMPYESDPNYLEETAFPVAKLYAGLAKLPSKDVTVVLDACFSGQGPRSLLAKGARPLVNVLAPKATGKTVILAAAASNQISASDPERRHGLLTSYILEGLHGAADASGDGKITAEEVFAFVRPAVERAARLQNLEQTPTLSLPTDGLRDSSVHPWIILPRRRP